jgi:SAM-dependent methyltransferase
MIGAIRDEGLSPLGGFDPQETYSAAAEDYARAARTYWQFLSTRTVEQAGPRWGDSVLDAACGTGPATIACASRVGPAGRVTGVDYAAGMLDIARRDVSSRDLTHVELVQADMLTLPYGEEFDVVLCVLGIFFVEDMTAAARALWSHVRPGGRLLVTTFGYDVWTPVLGRFIEEAGRVKPDIELVLPWRRTEDPDVLVETLRLGGVTNVEVTSKRDDVPFVPEDWRAIVMGSGLRRIAADLGSQADTVIAGTERWAREHEVTTVRVSSTYAMAVKPGAVQAVS